MFCEFDCLLRNSMAEGALVGRGLQPCGCNLFAAAGVTAGMNSKALVRETHSVRKAMVYIVAVVDHCAWSRY